MDDCTFKPRITIKPSALEFWPEGGWSRTRTGWQRFYCCSNKQIVRRAIVKPRRDGGWEFSVSEITRVKILAVALQPSFEAAAEPTVCLHAADNCACNLIKEARAL
jgi:hypothetical protein